MKKYRKTILYIGIALLIALQLYACEGSLTDPPAGPAEERILFIKHDHSIKEICTIKPNGTDLQIIASHDHAGEFIRQGYNEARWSPDKSHIAIKGGPSESLEFEPIWLMDNQGNLLYRLTWNGGCINWSSDGKEILFSKRTGYFSITSDYYIINVQTSVERLALKADTSFWWGGASDWSSDGQYLLTDEEYLYINEQGENEYSDREIIIIQLSDGEKIQLTDNDVQDGGGKWSPDESQIIYVSGKYTSGYQIKLMKSDGSDIETLVDTLASFGSVCWSPKGDKIAYSKSEMEGYAKYAQGSDIYVLDLNSGKVDQLTNFAADSVIVSIQDWK